MARFFIDRPILAWVLAIVVMLGGALAIAVLPLEQYPDIAPPRVSINAVYTGASAKTVEDSVTQVIEQRMKGLDNLLSMSSTSRASGAARITLAFHPGANIDVAQMQVQNKLQQAMSQLPQTVQAQGVTVTKGGSDFLMIVTLISPDGRASAIDIGDYISGSLADIVSRLDGVGEVQTLGSGYAMRIWLDPAKLNQYALMPSDVSAAVLAQNTQVSAGQLGGLPAVAGQQITATVTSRSKLRSADDFREVALKSSADGAVVRLKHVARVELGAESLTVRSRLNGQPAAGMGIVLADGANALVVARAVQAKVSELEPFFPLGMKAVVGYDTTPFVSASILGVARALLEAMLLVVVVMYVFLQNWRATLIPAIAVPVVLLGTFGVLALCGYSINTLTMFGLVLAIGLLVDDAIVVVENVERVMGEQGLGAREATRRSMAEITPALVGIALVLSAVFIPMAFFGGSTGVIYRQFSITVVSAMVLSVLVALTLTPALCASLLKPHASVDYKVSGHRRWLARGFSAFNRGFSAGAGRYQRSVAAICRRAGRGLVVYALIAGAMAVLYHRLPTSFLPDEDQGTLNADIKLPPDASDARLQQVIQQVEAYLAKQPDVESVNFITGQNGDQASGRGFIKLKPWSQRPRADQAAAAIAKRATLDLARLRDARIKIELPAAVRGLGGSAGFMLQLKDLGDVGHAALVDARDRFQELADAHPLLTDVRSRTPDDAAQFAIDIDDDRAGALGLSAAAVNATLSGALGGVYINDFLLGGRVKKVFMQGDAAFRMRPGDHGPWSVRGATGEMVPFSAFSSTRWTHGSPVLQRYNGSPAYEFVGDPAERSSSGTAMAAVETVLKQMPAGIGHEWAGASLQERLAGAQAPLLYALSLLFVFLCLAALYESWSIPFSVLLVVPLGIVGALALTSARGMSNDVYFQVGLLATVGLSAKNAILIVEFAKQLQEQGRGLVDATLEAARLRLRPILMTSLAFGAGVLPLAFSSGAGAGSRQSIGTAVLGGMLSATALGVFFVPLFYVLVRSAGAWLVYRRRPAPQTQEA